ncbi:hypothetical protein BYT27DRAFT_7222578 [Phlegmacium glaucopus]|nr:hypothetical protein BYT27DRAFT_7222578 [Phlegmacium glaucopus]
MSLWCPSCCAGCFVAEIPSESSDGSPYSLINLLPVGSVFVKLGIEPQHLICDHTHAQDGWHNFNAHSIIPHLSDPEDASFCRQIEFLVKHRFIVATYRATHDAIMALRIYLIPYDLSNVQGKLRVRVENILTPAKRYMRQLLPRIINNEEIWNGLKPTAEVTALILDPKDRRTLADIYSGLASPSAIPVPGYGDISSRLFDFEDKLEGLGIRSTLYRYQRRSVAAMLQRELDNRNVPDPLFIPLTTVDKRMFFLQPGTMEVLQERPMIAPCQGGILCEELGTGKTLMILSLIAATKNQLSAPEPSVVDNRPVMTPLSFRHFPSAEYSTSRKRFSRGKHPHEVSRVPSLVQLMLHRGRVVPYCDIPKSHSSKQYCRSIEIEDEVNTLPLGKMLRENTPFYHYYHGDPSIRDRTPRNRRDQGPKVMYLTSATLVIVPANLLNQWDGEITKHCSIPLRVLMLRTKTPMPSVKSLATDFDIILLSYTKFTAEANSQDVSKLHSWKPCSCDEFPASRVPICRCQTTEVSPFLQIRWKRLVIDEGHVSATLSTALVPFAKLLSVERRWIVTGTPTTNLLGLSFGTKSNEMSNSQLEGGESENMEDREKEDFRVWETDEEGDETMEVDEMQMGSSASHESTPSLSSAFPTTSLPAVETQQMSSKKRIWNKYDRGDLNKLGNMITHFIAVPQFNADPKLITSHIIEPLLDATGPRPGSIQVLNQVMEMTMIRHRIEHVEVDVVLPPVSQESVLLDLDPYVVKSFNALQAAITINAVDSQRKDQDYMFHPRNTDVLQLTLKNMSQLLFWFVSDDLYNAQQLVADAEGYVKKAIERGMASEDISAIQMAFMHLRIALADPLWKLMQAHEDVPYRAFHMNEPIYNAWSRTPGNEPSCDPNQTGFLHADRLLKLYDIVKEKPLISQPALIELGHRVGIRDQAFRKAYEESQRKRKGRKSSKHNDEFSALSQSKMADNFAKKASAADTLREMQQELDGTLARLARDEDDHEQSSTSGPSSAIQRQVKGISSLAAASPLSTTRIGSSASSKLNYIIDEVLKYSSKEKILIFSESPLSLAHIAEALQLIHVKFLRFTTQVPSHIREQLVLTFESSGLQYPIFLMELKHGARGLNLISASRVIFCEPVWQADVESQAIKRAHRIGQTRPITVKTLAIRGTSEENMVARRELLKKTQEKIPKLIEEAGMRHYIAVSLYNPKFINHDPASSGPVVDFSLIDLPPQTLQPPPGSIMFKIPALPKTPPSLKRVRVEDPLRGQEDSPTKKQKNRIRLASP